MRYFLKVGYICGFCDTSLLDVNKMIIVSLGVFCI